MNKFIPFTPRTIFDFKKHIIPFLANINEDIKKDPQIIDIILSKQQGGSKYKNHYKKTKKDYMTLKNTL